MNIQNKEQMSYALQKNTELRNKLLNKHSDAEKHFEEMLSFAGLYFRREKANFKIGTRWCYYDFYLPYYSLYIEIDGKEHETEEQKAINREKELQAMRNERFMVRYTNEEVVAMDAVSIDAILERCFAQSVELRRTGRKKRPAEHHKGVYEKIMKNKREGAIINMNAAAKFKVEPDQEVWLYDNAIGLYFHFPNIYEAKFSVEMTINEIHDMLEQTEFTHSFARRYVFAYTREDCETKVLNAL